MINKVINKLPKEYQEVEYLKGDQKSWIDTNVQLNNIDSYEFEIKATLRDFNEPDGALYGTMDYASGFMAVYRNNSLYDAFIANSSFYSYGKYSKYIGETITHKLIIDKDNNTFVSILNETIRRSYIIGDFKNNKNILIYKAGQEQYGIKQDEVYYFKITQNGVLVRDLIPCYRKSDNVAGMYDLVSGTFFTNKGSGEFIVGADISHIKKILSVKHIINNELKDIRRIYKGNKLMFNILPEEYQEVEYLESTGTQYINTGINPKIKPRVIINFAFKNNEDKDYFGNNNIDGSAFYGNFYNKNLSYYRYGNIAALNTLVKVNAINVFNVWDISEKVYLNGELKYTVPAANVYTYNENQTNIYIFTASRNNNEFSNISAYKLKSFKLYDGDNFVRYFIPCYRKVDNVAGLYDLITKKFFTNQGTGEFIVGGDV